MSADESITSLPEAVAVYGALPMPAGPAPQGLDLDACVSRALRLARQHDGPDGVDQGDLDQLTDFDVPQLVAEVRGGRIELEKARAEIANHGPVLTALERERARVAELEADLAAKAQDAEAAVNGWGRARDRIAELEAERRSTNEALDDAVQELRRRKAGPALPWAHTMSDHDLHGFLDDLVSAAMGRWRSEPEVPDRTVLADIEKVCAAWRTPGQGHRLDGSEFDGVTVRLTPRVVEVPDGEHYAVVHHTYRVGHDLPETGGAS
ncbi:hypothetical protein [Streptomyces scabiei]|uniref:hypothetical protein n=1 Tax=Streptomyces scabiei TaxID=1930 RepID=UPI0029A1D765|nr:hypothetical protein [Streptomyces scabiei]MDX3520779.1 hypothetical protein [Streptomyces scabiei]